MLAPTAIGLAGYRVRLSVDERRSAYLRVLAEYLVVFVAALVYFLQSASLDWIQDGKLRTVLQVVWPALLMLGLVPAIAMEMSLFSMRAAPTVEIWRVRFAARSARIVVLAVIAFAGFNFAATKWNRKVDLSYFKTTEVGTSTQNILKNMTKPVRFVLFFPTGNDVLEQVRTYTDELTKVTDKVTVEVADQALDTELAKKLKVRANGNMAIVRSSSSTLIWKMHARPSGISTPRYRTS